MIDDNTNSLAEASARWSHTFRARGSSSNFNIGSHSFLRSHGHRALLDHLDRYQSQPQDGLRDMMVPTISASMFLPQKSVWAFRHKDKDVATRPERPDSTPEPKLRLWHRMRKQVKSSSSRVKHHSSSWRDGQHALRDRFALWDMIAEDFIRQETIPGLQSGNTVIDERNFALS